MGDFCGIVFEMINLEELNEQQKKAVHHKDGALLILAGAGAGKTRVITHRIQNLISNGVAPESILAVTFTNKAAKEMRARVNALLEKSRSMNMPISVPSRPYVSTFHSLGVHIIRENCRLLGVSRHFSIFDRNDSTKNVKEAIVSLGLDPKEFEPRKILSVISKQKGDGVSVSEYEEKNDNNYFSTLVADVWRKYESLLKREKALDFDDLLLRAVDLLKRYPKILAHYQAVWKYLHIDEYQDTNKIQYELSRLLSEKKGNICVVGDIDQNIYSWRGADLGNILRFEENYPGAEVILLEENYRSTKTILNASNEIIKKNKNRFEKNLFTKNVDGEKISLSMSIDESHEAAFVVSRIKELIEKKIEPKEVAVLYRANFQSRILEEQFLAEKVPYQVLGVRFFERKEVKDTLAFLRAALARGRGETFDQNITDIKRISNVPPRGIGKVTLFRMIEGKEHELGAGIQKKVDDFKTLLDGISRIAVSERPSKTVAYILSASGLEKKLKDGSEDDKEKLENIKELVTLASRYDVLSPEEGIGKLLEDAALASDQDELKEDKNAVRLMTVHASKGLEFDYVFIVGLEEGLFPQHREGPDSDTEEERRLFYVALTRARKKVFLSYASSRTIFGSREINLPSEFISDIDDRLIEVEEGGVGETLETIFFD